jgi:hypothetical protein
MQQIAAKNNTIPIIGCNIGIYIDNPGSRSFQHKNRTAAIHAVAVPAVYKNIA